MPTYPHGDEPRRSKPKCAGTDGDPRYGIDRSVPSLQKLFIWAANPQNVGQAYTSQRHHHPIESTLIKNPEKNRQITP